MSLELLSIGADLLGGILGSQSQKKMHAQQLRQAQKQFDAQMNESVQRRVKDAQSAGVHPLFALGASVGASPTISSGSAPESNPMQAALTNMARTLGVIEQNRASAKRDEAEAALLDSERARIEQDMRSKGSDSTKTPEGPEFPPAPTGYRNPGRGEGGQGGRFPDRIRMVDTAGNEYDLPNPDLGLDEVGQIEYVLGVPKRAYDTMKNNAQLKKEIRDLDRELTYLREQRLNPGATQAQIKSAQRDLAKIYKRYSSLRSKAKRWWKEYSSKPSVFRRNLDKHPIYRGLGK